ncbi:MAG: hypothetical protein Q9220_005567 [cf. Caloplaca sp. 1 TL-2023]
MDASPPVAACIGYTEQPPVKPDEPLNMLPTVREPLASPVFDPRPFDTHLIRRQSVDNSSTTGPVVDLGYERYQGVANTTTGLNTFKGIRYAAPPTGTMRWQAPAAPTINRDEVLSADALPPSCPQSPQAPIFIGVIIQYRVGLLLKLPIVRLKNTQLGAFGFLSSDEVYRYGTVNAGILDQTFALQWVQTYIGLFGGNSSQVTIAGVSAGDFVPTQFYYAFAAAVGCFNGLPQANANDSVFNCLVSKDTDALQNASATISGSGRYGVYGFLPVTDGTFIQQLPSQQLLTKKVNGKRILSGNNANEGPLFTPQDIVSEDDFINFLRTSFPLFTEDDISRLLLYYPSTNASVSMDATNYATYGTSGPSALNQSSFGTGQQQRADNVYGETTFVCPSYWLAEAFTNHDRIAYKYQYSIIPAQHGADQNGYFGPALPNQGSDFEKAFMTIWGNFITTNNPSISADIALGVNGASALASNASDASTDPLPNQSEAAANWPAYTLAAPYQLNLNQSGGVPFEGAAYPGPTSPGGNITQFSDPGKRNDFTLVNAYTWEGGRGMRCDFWRSIARIVPE